MPNKKVTELPTNTSPSGAEVYAAETGIDYRIPVGGNNGISFLGATGLVPTANLGVGIADGTTYLRGDGTWATVSVSGGGGGAGGTVTSINITPGTGVTATGGPITGSGSISVGLNVNLQGWSAVAVSSKADTVHSHAAADITSGVLATARLGTGTASASTYLRGDGTWASVSGSGTVTSVAMSGGTTGLTFTGGPVTTTGTFTAAGTLAVGSGGTGAATAADARTNLGAAPTASPSFTGTVSIAGTGSWYGDTGFMRSTNAIRSADTTKDQKMSADGVGFYNVSRVFVQAGDPGAAAADGDLWIF